MNNDTKNSVLVLIPRISNYIEKYLVYIAPNNTIFAGKYRFVGGKIKTLETYKMTLKRELKEEYGVNISNIELLYEKPNVIGGQVFLCLGIIDEKPIKKEEDVGDPEWKAAEELFQSNLVPNNKIGLYCYLLKYDVEKLNSMISIIKKDKNFIDFLSKEAKDLYTDLIERIKFNF